MFRVFDEGFLAGTSVAILDSLLINGISALTFFGVLWLGRSPSAFETWRAFVQQSRVAGNPPEGGLQVESGFSRIVEAEPS